MDNEIKDNLCIDNHKSISIITKCCNKRVCWLCYSKAIVDTSSCDDCGVKICKIGCKKWTIAYGGLGYIDYRHVCEKCHDNGLKSGKYSKKKNYNDIDVWLG